MSKQDDAIKRELTNLREYVSRAREAHSRNDFGTANSFLRSVERSGMNLEDKLLSPPEIRGRDYQTLTAHEKECKHCHGKIQSEWTPQTCPFWGQNPDGYHES